VDLRNSAVHRGDSPHGDSLQRALEICDEIHALSNRSEAALIQALPRVHRPARLDMVLLLPDEG
jgi:hypothetical protein